MRQIPYERVKTARGNDRPTGLDYIHHLFRGFIELHGDRRFGDDAAVVGGLARLDGEPVTVIAIEKGHSAKERAFRNSGAPHPEGYRKALRLMKQAEKFGRPVICFVDTAGAYCGSLRKRSAATSTITSPGRMNLPSSSKAAISLITAGVK